MFTHNDQTKARFPLSLDGRGARGEGVLRSAKTALVALFLAAPGAALAQNECGAQVGTTPVECDQSTYGSGVTYDAVGDLFIDFTNADSPARSTIGGSGITLTGDGSETITFDSATTETEIRNSSGTTGPLLGVTTVDGNINIATEEMNADAFSPPDVTHAIFAESTGSGSINITTTGNVDAQGANPADSIGIQAITGLGSLTITASGQVFGNDVGIDASTGTGLLTINVTGDSGSVRGIRTNAGGGTIINVGVGSVVSSSIQATGNTLTLNNSGFVTGNLDFTTLTDGYTFNNNAGARWFAGSNLGAGDLNNAGEIHLNRAYASALGATYTGTGASQLRIDRVILDGTGQADCTGSVISSCFDLSGGSTAGQTSILIETEDSNPDPFAEVIDTPINPGIVLVDVGGGTSAAEHFVLDPGSDNYVADPVYGGVIDTAGRGLFDYALLYNPQNQQHVLTSVPQHEALEYAALIHESLSVWHTTSDAVAGRQADLRDGGERGGWIRVFTDKTERDFKPTVTTHGNTFNYDRGYELDTRGVIAGYDLTADDSHVFGVHLGFVGMRLDHDDSPTNDEAEFLDGASSTFGAYAGWWNETGLTLDGTLNVNLLDIAHDVRDGLEDTRTNVISVGVRAEAGWRFPLAESFYVQPLVTAAYAYADVERLDMRDYDAKFEDEHSMRAALGVRLGGGTDLTGDKFSRLKYWLTARAWEEYAEDGNVQFATGGDPLIIEDDISEGFEEVGLGVSLTSPDESLEVFLSGNIRSGDQTDGNNVTVGARLNW